MTRRGRGEGTITKVGEGQWRAGMSRPGMPRQWFRGKTRAEALAKLRKATEARDRGEGGRSGDSGTVAAFLRTWLDGTRHRIVPSTWTRYEELVRIYAIPAVGHRRLERLTPAHLQQLYAAVVDAGRSPTTAKQLHAVIHRALSQAERWSLVQRNVAALVDKPKAIRTEQHTWTLEQARRFFDAIRDDPLEALYVVAITTGMRQGEILGLRWDMVDLERGAIYIARTNAAVADAKNPTSRRFVALSGIAVAALHRLRFSADNIHQKTQSESIFPLTADQLRHRYWKLLAAARLPRIRFHDLRHTIATLLLQEGVHPKKVGEMLGHSSIVVTMDRYSHVSEGMHAEVASVIDGLFSPKMLPTP